MDFSLFLLQDCWWIRQNGVIVDTSICAVYVILECVRRGERGGSQGGIICVYSLILAKSLFVTSQQSLHSLILPGLLTRDRGKANTHPHQS
jgi:hypothetical protein